ncbi:MAG: glycosyltransferase [Bacteroidetes bacterium]|nr:glycosyltransferase [Bacteroidota bacterium]
MSQPKLSIITINYNDAQGLQLTMQSVLEQSFRDFEYIIIDGGSTDDSLAVINQHERNINHWVSEPDKGVFHAQNKGIDQAAGEYLFFLNSGDRLTSESALSDFINHPEFKGDVIYGDYQFDEGQKVYPDSLSPFYFMKSSLPHQSTLFHRRVFEKMGGYDESFKIAADRAFFLKCYLSEEFKFQHIHYLLTHFDLSGISNNPEYLQLKREEDEMLFKQHFGVYYDDLKSLAKSHEYLADLQRNSAKGVWKRIKKRLSK